MNRGILRSVVGVGLATIFLLATLPTVAQNRDHLKRRHGDLISIFSGDLHVPADENREGMILAIGADARVEGRAREAVVILGSLQVEGGQIRRQVVGVLSKLEFKDAYVGDQVVNVLGTLDADAATEFLGNNFDLSFNSEWFPGINGLLLWYRLLSLLLSFGVLIFLVALVPDRVRRIGEEALVRYVPAFFVGLLTYLGFVVVGTLLSATLIGLPIAVAGYYVLKWLGIAGIFYAVGRRLGRIFGGEMSLLGACLLVFAIYAAIRLYPSGLGLFGLLLGLLNWVLFFLLVEVPGVGMLMLTRFGGYSSGGGATVVPPPAATPPPPPASSAI